MVRVACWVSLASLFLACRGDTGPGETDPDSDSTDDGYDPATAIATVDAAETELVANGTAETAITVTLADASGTPAPDGTAVVLTSSLGTVEIGAITGGVAAGRLVTGNVPGTATLAVADVAEVAGDTAVEFLAGNAFSAQLHLHGPISEDDGTHAWQIAQAEKYGVDALWWTDHDWLYLLLNAEESPPIDEGNFNTTPGSGASYWSTTEPSGSDVTAELVTDPVYDGDYAVALTVSTEVPDVKAEHRGSVSWRSAGGGVRRAALGDVEAAISIRLPDDWDPTIDQVRVIIDLSCEGPTVDGVTQLVYQDPSDYGKLNTRQIGIPVSLSSPGWNTITMPITEDVLANLGHLDTGIDKVTVEMSHTGPGSASVVFDGLTLTQDVCCEDLMARQRVLVDELDPEQDIVQFIGQEISNADLHMNAFGEGVSFVDYQQYKLPDDAAAIVAQVHDEGGVVSYNHVFGVTVGESAGDPEAEAQIQCDRLLETRAFGTDLLEVGYLRRGYDLEYHLRVWDCVGRGSDAAAPVFITGIGTSDLHRNDDWAEFANPFVTWAWSEELTEDGMLAGLVAGRAFFGDPTVFPHEVVEFDLLAASGAAMGQVVTPAPASDEVRVRLSPVEAGWTVRLLGDGAILAETEVDASGTFDRSYPIDPSAGLVVRAELWSGEEPLLFSNPIYYRADAVAVPAERVPNP